MKLTIYADELFTSVREVREVPRMKIPYRAAEKLAVLLSELDLSDDTKVLTAVLENTDLITKVVQATFALQAEDLEYIDLMELGDLAKQIIAHVMAEIGRLGVYAAISYINGVDPHDTLNVEGYGPITLRGDEIIMASPLIMTAENVDNYNF